MMTPRNSTLATVPLETPVTRLAFIALLASLTACSRESARAKDPAHKDAGAAKRNGTVDSWCTTLVQEWFIWNGEFEGLTNKKTTQYEVKDGEAVGAYCETHAFRTKHSFADEAVSYAQYSEPDEHGNFQKIEYGHVEDAGDQVLESTVQCGYDYDAEGRVIRKADTATDAEGNSTSTAEEYAYDAKGNQIVEHIYGPDGVDSVPEEDDSLTAENSFGDSLHYSDDIDGTQRLSSITIYDSEERVIYEIDGFPDDFDPELTDVNDCSVTGYHYCDNNNVEEKVIWEGDDLTVVHYGYDDEGHLLYCTNYSDQQNVDITTITTYGYLNILTDETLDPVEPLDVEVQTQPQLVPQLQEYLDQRQS